MRQIALVVGAALLFAAAPANGQWKMLKKFIQQDVVVVEETKVLLVLKHPELSELMVVALKDGAGEADIEAATVQERGGNPYRIWVASEKLINEKPKQVWGRFFRSEFLRLLRAPDSGPDSRGH